MSSVSSHTQHQNKILNVNIKLFHPHRTQSVLPRRFYALKTVIRLYCQSTRQSQSRSKFFWSERKIYLCTNIKKKSSLTMKGGLTAQGGPEWRISTFYDDSDQLLKNFNLPSFKISRLDFGRAVLLWWRWSYLRDNPNDFLSTLLSRVVCKKHNMYFMRRFDVEQKTNPQHLMGREKN